MYINIQLINPKRVLKDIPIIFPLCFSVDPENKIFCTIEILGIFADNMVASLFQNQENIESYKNHPSELTVRSIYRQGKLLFMI